MKTSSVIWRSTQEAEGTPLERVQVVNSGARVQIPPSPFSSGGNMSTACTLTNKQQCNPEDSKRENSEKRRNKPKAVKRKEQLVVVLDRKLFNESLILAQDERWRRA